VKNIQKSNCRQDVQQADREYEGRATSTDIEDAINWTPVTGEKHVSSKRSYDDVARSPRTVSIHGRRRCVQAPTRHRSAAATHRGFVRYRFAAASRERSNKRRRHGGTGGMRDGLGLQSTDP